MQPVSQELLERIADALEASTKALVVIGDRMTRLREDQRREAIIGRETHLMLFHKMTVRPGAFISPNELRRVLREFRKSIEEQIDAGDDGLKR